MYSQYNYPYPAYLGRGVFLLSVIYVIYVKYMYSYRLVPFMGFPVRRLLEVSCGIVKISYIRSNKQHSRSSTDAILCFSYSYESKRLQFILKLAFCRLLSPSHSMYFEFSPVKR